MLMNLSDKRKPLSVFLTRYPIQGHAEAGACPRFHSA